MPGSRPNKSRPQRPVEPASHPPERFQAPAFDATAEFERRLEEGSQDTFQLRLFITGTTQRSMAAISNIRALCEQFLAGNFELEVIDIYQQPLEAAQEQIIAAPTLIRESPAPVRRIVGDLSDAQRVLTSLELLQPVSLPKKSEPKVEAA